MRIPKLSRLVAVVVLALIIFTPSSDPRVIRHECEAWHVSTYAGTPWRAVACDPDGLVFEPNRVDSTFIVQDPPVGWLLAFRIRACSLAECSEWVAETLNLNIPMRRSEGRSGRGGTCVLPEHHTRDALTA